MNDLYSLASGRVDQLAADTEARDGSRERASWLEYTVDAVDQRL